MDHNVPKIVTVVLELNDGQTVEKLYEIYKNSMYVEGARILNILSGDIPELLNECEHQYNSLLLEESI